MKLTKMFKIYIEHLKLYNSLGYVYIRYNDYFKKKFKFSRFVSISIVLNSDKSEIDDFGVEYKNDFIKRQYQIDNLQQTFNELQNDLEELKQYEL